MGVVRVVWCVGVVGVLCVVWGVGVVVGTGPPIRLAALVRQTGLMLTANSHFCAPAVLQTRLLGGAAAPQVARAG